MAVKVNSETLRKGKEAIAGLGRLIRKYTEMS